MQNPAHEIGPALKLVVTAVSPIIQKNAVYRYFLPDAEFRHPFSFVPSSPLSRENILGIYQSLRVVTSAVIFKVESVVYDELSRVAILEVRQTCAFWKSPFSPLAVRYLCRMTLREVNGKLYISKQENFFHPDDFAGLIAAPLAPIVRAVLSAATTLTVFLGKSAQVLGVWRVPPGVAYHENGGTCSDRTSMGRHADEEGGYKGTNRNVPNAKGAESHDKNNGDAKSRKRKARGSGSEKHAREET